MPSLTSQGRFVHGPAFGHPPILGTRVGRLPVRRGVVIATPVVVSGYYPVPAYPYPVETVPPYDATPAPPPAIAYAPMPYIEQSPPASIPSTPIYYCAELHAYTNELGYLDCPGGWQRMTR